MKKKFLIVLLLVCSMFLVACGSDDKDEKSDSSGSAKEVAKEFLDGYTTGNGKSVCKVIVPAIMEDEYEDIDECAEDFEDFIVDLLDDATMTYTIKSEEKVTGEDLDETIEDLVDQYDTIKKDDITAAYKYSVELKLGDETQTQDLYIVKYKGTWYAAM